MKSFTSETNAVALSSAPIGLGSTDVTLSSDGVEIIWDLSIYSVVVPRPPIQACRLNQRVGLLKYNFNLQLCFDLKNIIFSLIYRLIHEQTPRTHH